MYHPFGTHRVALTTVSKVDFWGGMYKLKVENVFEPGVAVTAVLLFDAFTFSPEPLM